MECNWYPNNLPSRPTHVENPVDVTQNIRVAVIPGLTAVRGPIHPFTPPDSRIELSVASSSESWVRVLLVTQIKIREKRRRLCLVCAKQKPVGAYTRGSYRGQIDIEAENITSRDSDRTDISRVAGVDADPNSDASGFWQSFLEVGKDLLNARRAATTGVIDSG
jgi:hypothetical protein